MMLRGWEAGRLKVEEDLRRRAYGVGHTAYSFGSWIFRFAISYMGVGIENLDRMDRG
jgi:hypothetical protein